MGFNSGFKGLIVSSHQRPGLPSGLFPSRFLNIPLYALFFSALHTTRSTHLILDLVTLTILVKKHKSRSSL